MILISPPASVKPRITPIKMLGDNSVMTASQDISSFFPDINHPIVICVAVYVISISLLTFFDWWYNKKTNNFTKKM